MEKHHLCHLTTFQITFQTRREKNKMQIFVTNLRGQTLTLNVCSSSGASTTACTKDTIDTIKQLIEEREGIPMYLQRLTTSTGKLLDDDKDDEIIQLENESSLVLSLRLLGGILFDSSYNKQSQKQLKHMTPEEKAKQEKEQRKREYEERQRVRSHYTSGKFSFCRERFRCSTCIQRKQEDERRAKEREERREDNERRYQERKARREEREKYGSCSSSFSFRGFRSSSRSSTWVDTRTSDELSLMYALRDMEL